MEVSGTEPKGELIVGQLKDAEGAVVGAVDDLDVFHLGPFGGQRPISSSQWRRQSET